MEKPPFVFFDLGQTLVDEWDFIAHFDQKFLELLNGFGARIDQRNYSAVRNSVIRDRKIGHGSVSELIIEVCRMVLPPGYETAIAGRFEPQIKEGRKMFRFFDDAGPALKKLSKTCELGIIANQSEDILHMIEKSGMGGLFKVKAISGVVKLKKPDPKMFELAIREAGRPAAECVMVGDRLDTDVCPANRIGMTTVRTTNSLFALQSPMEKCEFPKYTTARLAEIPEIIERIISS